MKSLILIIFVAISLNATSLKKIEQTTPQQQEIKKIEAAKEKPVDLIQHPVKYEKTYDSYSIVEHTKEEYKKIMLERKLDQISLKSIFNTVKSENGLVMSAYGYDYVYERADLAENFYTLFLERESLNTYDRIRAADYFLRTGRPDKISQVIRKSDCMSSLQHSGQCFYYLGLEVFLKTGENRNIYMKIAKDKVKKAKEIFE